MARTQHTGSLCFSGLQTGRKAEEGSDDSAMCSLPGGAGGRGDWKVRELGFLEIWRSQLVPSTPTPKPTLNTNHRTRIIRNRVHEPGELLVAQGHLKSDKVRVRTSSSLAAISLLLPQGRRSKPFLHSFGGLEPPAHTHTPSSTSLGSWNGRCLWFGDTQPWIQV